MHPYASFAGEVVGGFIAIYLLSALIEWAILKRVLDDPVQGKVGSVVAAWLIGSIIYSQNSPWGPSPFIIYGIPAVAIGAWKYRSGLRLREQQIEE